MRYIKAWTPIIVALLALIGCVWSAYYQSGRTDQSDAAVRALVDQLNDRIIPQMQEAIAEIRERLAVIEAGCCRVTAERHAQSGGMLRLTDRVKPEKIMIDLP